MAFLGLKIQNDIAEKLKRIDVPGNKEDELHLTMCYFPDKLSLSDISKVIEVMISLTEKLTPFEIELIQVNCFPKGDDGVPVKIEVESGVLQEIRLDLVNALDEVGVEYSKKFPDFNPHITLSYSEEEIKPLKFKTTVKLLISELCFWAGDWGPTKLVCNFPLEFQTKEAKNRVGKQILKMSHLINYFVTKSS